MLNPGSGFAFARWACASGIALVLVWRILVIGLDDLISTDPYPSLIADMMTSGDDLQKREKELRKQIPLRPFDAKVYFELSKVLQSQRKTDEAKAAMEQALRMDSSHPRILLTASRFFLDSGDVERGLSTLQRSAELYPDDETWKMLLSELESGRGRAFLDGARFEEKTWWPEFFRWACDKAANPEVLEAAYLARAVSGILTDSERKCLVGRAQREGNWQRSRQLWITGLPNEQKPTDDGIFNGGFETPLSGIGFDWIVRPVDGVTSEALPSRGARGSKALRVAFANKRYADSPIYEYMMLRPGRYTLSGAARADRLETWLGVQWGMYCLSREGKLQRQLVRTRPFLGTTDWFEFQNQFAVPAECQVQMLRLELSNPQADAQTAGSVAARLRGAVWFDDLAVRPAN